MIIDTIYIKQLFGLFDHTIKFKHDSNVTIIFSPNGFGKSNILNAVNYFFAENLFELSKIPFEQIDITFLGNEIPKLTIEHLTKDVHFHVNLQEDDDPFSVQNINENFPLKIYQNGYKDREFIFGKSLLTNLSDNVSHLNLLEEYLPNLKRMDATCWYDYTINRTVNLREIISTYSTKLPVAYIQRLNDVIKSQTPRWLQEIISSQDVLLIATQRLNPIFTGTTNRPVLPIIIAARDLSEKILSNLKVVEEVSQELERSYPFRLIRRLKLKANRHEDMQDALQTIKQKLSKLHTQRIELENAGILEKTTDGQGIDKLDINDANLDDNTSTVLNLYTEDVAEKFKLFDNLYQKITLFRSIINLQFSNKELIFNKEFGFRILVKNPITHKQVTILSPANLSSGEQHIMLLFYKLIFNTKARTLILIDEPEISLHIAWQLDFLRNISKIAVLNEFAFLIATHSPQIINDQWDNTIDLAEQVNG